jgi:hypothetical protein
VAGVHSERVGRARQVFEGADGEAVVDAAIAHEPAVGDHHLAAGEVEGAALLFQAPGGAISEPRSHGVDVAGGERVAAEVDPDQSVLDAVGHAHRVGLGSRE